MKRRMALHVLRAGLALLLFSACAAPVVGPVSGSPQGEARVLSDVRAQYRNASLVVAGLCEGSHTDAYGSTCYDITVTEVYAGNVEAGDRMHCPGRVMQEGETYLLFLSEGEDVHYAEDQAGYELLSDTPLPISGGEVIWNGKRLALDTFREEVTQLQKAISAPAPVYYYDTLTALAESADEIFIGRVKGLTSMEPCEFVTRNGGSMAKAQYEAAIATIETYGSIKGVFSYGQQIEMVYSPDRVVGMLDAETLHPTNHTTGGMMALEEEGIYLFFLMSGPDSKQEYFFPINPVQGFVGLQGEALAIGQGNLPLQPYDKLTQLVLALQEALRDVEQVQETPPLIVEEE